MAFGQAAVQRVLRGFGARRAAWLFVLQTPFLQCKPSHLDWADASGGRFPTHLRGHWVGTQLWVISEPGWPPASDLVVKGSISLPSPMPPEPLITFPKRWSQAEGGIAHSICSAWQSGLRCHCRGHVVGVTCFVTQSSQTWQLLPQENGKERAPCFLHPFLLNTLASPPASRLSVSSAGMLHPSEMHSSLNAA